MTKETYIRAHELIEMIEIFQQNIIKLQSITDSDKNYNFVSVAFSVQDKLFEDEYKSCVIDNLLTKNIKEIIKKHYLELIEELKAELKRFQKELEEL